MSSNARIHNISSDRRIKRSQALGRIEQCISAWVEPDRSIRDLTLAESIAHRSLQSRINEPLPFAEIPGLTYQPSPSGQSATQHSRQLVNQANQFCANVG